MSKKSSSKATPPPPVAQAPKHGALVDDLVHVFVDDQNLFFGAVNKYGDGGFRIDFGTLLMLAARTRAGTPRGVSTAFMAGVVPDSDSFWQVAKNQGFDVARGYIGAGGRSKQDDALLITQIMKVLFTKRGPSTIVLVAGDADYGPPLHEAIKMGWRVEVVFHDQGVSAALAPVAHDIRIIHPADYERVRR